MKEVLVDTSALYAYLNNRDLNHERVMALFRSHQDWSFILTSYVFDELVTLVKSRIGIRSAISTGRRLRNSGVLSYLYITPEDEARAWSIFEQYDDKDWSFTDCTCLAIMQSRGIDSVLSLDHHFRQMGVVVYPQ